MGEGSDVTKIHPEMFVPELLHYLWGHREISKTNNLKKDFLLFAEISYCGRFWEVWITVVSDPEGHRVDEYMVAYPPRHQLEYLPRNLLS